MYITYVGDIERFKCQKLSEDFYKVFLRDNITQINEKFNSCNEYTLVVPSPSGMTIEEAVELNWGTYLESAKNSDKIKFIENQIATAKKGLDNSDYKVLKYLEKSAAGAAVPYELSQLIYKRESLRSQVNELESDLKNFGKELSSEELADLDKTLLENEKQNKLTELHACCQATIYNGIEFNGQRFSLELRDQINLLVWSMAAREGKSMPYHADSELCDKYSAEELLAITQTATEFIVYQTTYFNHLKAQINSYTDIERVSAAYYGMDLDDYYKAHMISVLSQVDTNETTA